MVTRITKGDAVQICIYQYAGQINCRPIEDSEWRENGTKFVSKDKMSTTDYQ